MNGDAKEKQSGWAKRNRQDSQKYLDGAADIVYRCGEKETSLIVARSKANRRVKIYIKSLLRKLDIVESKKHFKISIEIG